MVVDIGEKMAPVEAARTRIFFWVTLKVEYGTSEVTGCSLGGSASGSDGDA